MKQILVLGAGKSSPYLIRHLLDEAAAHDWFVTVGDLDHDLAQQRVGGHARGKAIAFDVTDIQLRHGTVQRSDVVVSLLIPELHHLVAQDCVEHGVPLVTASYRDQAIMRLEKEALRKDVLILSEMGMDPGMDHMSAMAVIQRIRDAGGVITAFRSYGSGLPAPDEVMNPFKYVITWNPRNVVVASQYGAQYLLDGLIKVIPYHDVFHHNWDVEVEGVGTLEAFPNRDSLAYKKTFGLDQTTTMIRGTLRYPGWSETWAALVRLGLTNATVEIPDVETRTYRELVEMFLPFAAEGSTLERRVAQRLGLSSTGSIMAKLRWLGLFSNDLISSRGSTSADVLTALISEKLALPLNGRDVAIIQHEVDVTYPADGGRRERVVSTLVEQGEPGGLTAMSKAVGLPAAAGAKLILEGELPLAGCLLPTHPAIYEPVLKELESSGLVFRERTIPIE